MQSYRLSVRHMSQQAATAQMLGERGFSYLGYDIETYSEILPTQIRKCVESIFSSTEWCVNYMGVRTSVVTMWCSRLADVHKRVEDIYGLYKNRHISEAVCIMLVASDVSTGKFLSVDLDTILQNIDLEYRILRDVSLGMEWAIHLTQLNVILVTPDLDLCSPCNVCNPERIVLETNVSVKIAYRIYSLQGLRLASTMVDMTNCVAHNRYLDNPVCMRIGIDARRMQLMHAPP